MSTLKTKFSLEEINQMPNNEFISIFGFIFENSPLIVATVSTKRPFRSVHHFHGILVDVVSRLPLDLKEGLLMMYPDLGSKLDHLTDSSQNEHKSSGLVSLPADELELLRRLNSAFRSRNNFPFILCMREHHASDVCSQLEERLAKDRADSVELSIKEVCKIAWYRLVDLCQKDESVSMGPAVVGKL